MTMKVSILALLAVATDAFSVKHNSNLVGRRPSTYSSSRLFSDFGTAMPTKVSPYERIGIEEEDLAIGVNPDDVIQYLGTREDLIEKALADIPSFNRAQAESEVGKFLLDSDAISVFIEFNKRKAEDPDFEVPAEEEENGFFSFRTVVIFYLVYLAFTTGPTAFKKYVASKQETGDWNGSGIPFIDKWLEESMAAVDVDAVAQSVGDSVQTIVDNIN